MGVERNSYGCTPKGRVALAWWVAMAMAGSLLSGAPNQAAAQGVTHERVAGNVWRVDGAVDVIAVQSGADGLLMVDTGYPFAQAGVEAALRDIAGTDRADLLLNTHYHHTFSNHIYGVDAQVVAHANVGRRMGATNLMGGQVVPAMPEAGRPTRTFTDSLTLTYNGEQVTLLHLPGAHTDGDVAVIFHGSGVVLTGDVYVPHMPWSDMDAGGDSSLLLPAVERLLQVVPRDALLVPGHGPTGTYDDLLAFRDMLESARGTVSDRSSEGTSLRGIQSGGLPSLASWQGEGVPEALFIETVYRAAVPALRTEGPTVLYENGRWFDGVGFTAKTMYSVDGVLTDILQGPPDRTVNLGDGWVVPPFGEAHTHMWGDTSQLAKQGRTFMDDGVFYAMVQDPAHEVTAVHRTFAADPGTVDVAYTQGVVTPSWGMIADMYGMFAGMGMYGEGATVDDSDGEILFRLDTLEDLERAWPGLLARNDRFIKVILAFTDEHDVRMADPERYDAEPPRYSARPGVPPDIFRELVVKAHEAGLLISAHIETRADFRFAVDAGADLIAHMPAAWQIGEGTGYGAEEVEPWLLTLEDARAARMAGTAIATTLIVHADDPQIDLFNDVHRRNLTTLAQAGTKLVLGSDQFTSTSVAEALYLRTLDVFSDDALFRLLAVQTPRFIFPERRIGYLETGYEANFLVLGGSPIEDLANIRDIRIRVKQGKTLQTFGR